MEKGVFLDRDGVINRESGSYVKYPSDFHIHGFALEHIRRLHEAGFKIIVVTNQGGIGKDLHTREDVRSVHQTLLEAVESSGGKIDEIYFCPHHPVSGACLCRKPECLLIEKGLAKYRIDKQQALFIGDKPRDIEAAEAAGISGVMIEENEDWGFIVDDLIQKFRH